MTDIVRHDHTYHTDHRERRLSPLSHLLKLPDLPPDQIAFQGADVADIEGSVQMIGLMQEGARQQVLALHLEFLAFGIVRLHRDFLSTCYRLAKGWQTEAAFLAGLRPVLAHDHRINQSDLLSRV